MDWELTFPRVARRWQHRGPMSWTGVTPHPAQNLTPYTLHPSDDTAIPDIGARRESASGLRHSRENRGRPLVRSSLRGQQQIYHGHIRREDGALACPISSFA